MCFGSKSERDPSATGPKPAAVVPQQNSAAAAKAPYPAPPGPPPQHAPPAGNDEYAPPPGPPPQRVTPAAASNEDYAPPPGPPPPGPSPQRVTPAVASNEEYAPPPGPPPAQSSPPPAGHNNEYAPPSGHPPPRAPQPAAPTSDNYAPPPGPPPGYTNPAPPAPTTHQQHDWQAAVPDTSLFPPPPDIFSHHETSPANNSSVLEMEAGEAWCAAHPLSPPVVLDAAAAAARNAHNPRLMQPVNFRGLLRWLDQGHWELRTAARNCADATVLAYPPLYCASSPQQQRASSATAPTVIYYEVQIRNDSRPDEVSLAIGFSALPYPPFRLPGWHRASLAVHGDDGHRYTNDLAGGCSFTAPFRRGERVGLGIKFGAGAGRGGGGKIAVFFTRNGFLDGSWDLHEETDATEVGGVRGLEGMHDISAAIGTFDYVSLEVFFDPAKWMYRGGGQDVM